MAEISDKSDSPRPLWVDPIIKQIEIDSNHLLEQHRRLQQEIYVRLRSRLTLLNYAIGSVGGIVGIVTFLLSRQIYMIDTQPDPNIFLAVSAIFYVSSFIFIFFLLSFLSHAGYIYAASRLIAERFPEIVENMQSHMKDLSRFLGAPNELLYKTAASRIFSWESYITDTRKRVKFTDSKFEIISFGSLSFVSYLLHLAFFVFSILVAGKTANFSEIFYTVSACVFFVLFLIYAVTILYCRRTYSQVMTYRDGKLPDPDSFQGRNKRVAFLFKRSP